MITPRKRATSQWLFWITGACALMAVLMLAGILFSVAIRGLGTIDWAFLTEPMKRGGLEGGIVHHLGGTLILVTTALLIALPLAAGFGITQELYCRRESLKEAMGTAIYLLNGLPSILFGIVGYLVLVKWAGWGKSWLAGGIVLAVMMLPTITVAFVERLRQVPRAQIQAARGLGLSRSQLCWSILLPQASSGLITGSLLGVARAAGETAPILFTAAIFSGATWPDGLRESPVLSLPYHVFVLAQDALDPEAQDRLWGTAAVLLGLVMFLSALALPLRLRIRRHETS